MRDSNPRPPLCKREARVVYRFYPIYMGLAVYHVPIYRGLNVYRVYKFYEVVLALQMVANG